MLHDAKTLRLFVAAVELGSLTEAARQMHIALPAASRRVALLETQCGVRLLDRHPRGVRASAAGEAVVAQAREVLHALHRLEAQFADFRGGAHGVVRVVANASTIAQFLPADLGDFLRHHAGIRVRLLERSSAEAVQAVLSGEADLCLFEAHTPHARLATHRYREDRLVAVLAARHPLARRRTLGLDALLALDHVALRSGTAVHRRLHELAFRSAVALRVRMEVGSFEAMCLMVEQGVGVGVLPAAVAERAASHRAIRALRLDTAWASRVHLVGARGHEPLSAAAAALLDHLSPPPAAQEA